MDWLLTGLTAMLVILTGALIFYSVRMAHSSEKLQKAMEKLEKTEEEIAEIELAQIGASKQVTTYIPKDFLRNDLNILEEHIKVLSRSLEQMNWNWDNNKLKITCALNRIPDVLVILLANARQPRQILERIIQSPITVLIIQAHIKKQERLNELLQEVAEMLKGNSIATEKH